MKDTRTKGRILDWQLTGLQTVGMWPWRSNRVAAIACHVLAHLNMSCMALTSIGLALKLRTTDDLVDRSEAIDIFTLTTSATFKLYAFRASYEVFQELVHLINEGLPRETYFGSGLTIAEWTKYEKYFFLAHFIAGFITLFVWGASPLIKTFFLAEPMTYPANVWFPFNLEGWPFTLVYSIIYYALLISAVVYMAADGFLFSLLHNVTGQIRILRSSLEGMDAIKSNEESENALKKVIDHHSRLIYFLKKVDAMFRSMILADVMHAIISLSFAMLQASESKGLIESTKMAIFIFYCFFHQFLNSYFGQQCISEQEDLFDAIYNVKWEGRSEPYKKSLRIMLLRSYTPVRLSAWRMYYLRYETFVEFSKNIISYYMVLRRLEDG